MLRSRSRPVDVFLNTWKCSEWRCLQNEDGVENTLGTINYSFSLFFMKNYFVFKPASSSFRVADLKVLITRWSTRNDEPFFFI